MLYFLLIIIAIGVLLASEAGQEFLGFLIKLAIIGGLLWLGFWIIAIVIGFFTSDTGKSFANDAGQLIGGIGIVWVLYYGGNYFLKKRKEILGNIKGEFYNIWKNHKIFTIFLILSFSLIAFVLVYGSFTIPGFWE